MNYKEVLTFISRCLTINFDKKNKIYIKEYLQKNNIDWDSVIKTSSAHLVLPALYCNLKKVDLLPYLPENLISYMKYITDLNRERNKEIMLQAKQLNKLLLSKKITPIFLKGTGNLLANLYDDIAERMVGDIDFIFSQDDYIKAISVLKDDNYGYIDDYDYFYPMSNHYKSMVKKSNIAAIEIHKEILVGKYKNVFDFNFVNKNSVTINGFRVLSYADKLNLSILSWQINDKGQYYKSISLRNAYDVYLISQKTNAKKAISKLDLLFHHSNCFLASCYELFNVKSLNYKKNKKTLSYIKIFNFQLYYLRLTKLHHKLISCYLFITYRIEILYNVLRYKDCRVWFFKRIFDSRR